MNVIFLFFAPLITMGLFAAERKNRTIELLMTSPVRLSEMVLGKFLSAVLFLCVVLGITLFYPLVLFITGNPDIGPILTSMLGTLLMACCLLGLGIFFSACTENMFVAFALTFFSGLFFWLLPWAAQGAGDLMGNVIKHLGWITHFNNFSRGVINSTDLIYYLSFVGFFLFLTYRVLESYRWR